MDMMKELEEKGLGVIMDGIWCGGLMYADDIVLLAETGDELQDVVGHNAQEWRFRFNAQKSKMMRELVDQRRANARSDRIQIPRYLAGSEDERECADGENEGEG